MGVESGPAEPDPRRSALTDLATVLSSLAAVRYNVAVARRRQIELEYSQEQGRLARAGEAARKRRSNANSWAFGVSYPVAVAVFAAPQLFDAVPGWWVRIAFPAALALSVALVVWGRVLCTGPGVRHPRQRRWAAVALLGLGAADLALAAALGLQGELGAVTSAVCLAITPVSMTGLALMLWKMVTR